MTKSKTAGRLPILRRPDVGDVPAPWVPPDLPASNAAPGRAVATRDRTQSPPAPWVPAELPAAPAVKTDERTIGKLKPWVPPPAEAPRNLPATVPDDEDETTEPKRTKRGKRRKGELTREAVQPAPTIINIVNQIAAPAPAPVVYPLYWGWPWRWRHWWW